MKKEEINCGVIEFQNITWQNIARQQTRCDWEGTAIYNLVGAVPKRFGRGKSEGRV